MSNNKLDTLNLYSVLCQIYSIKTTAIYKVKTNIVKETRNLKYILENVYRIQRKLESSNRGTTTTKNIRHT